MSKVSLDDLDLAAQWLDCNEGDNGEMESCHRVRDWLLAEIKKREREGMVRSLAKEHGVSSKVARRAVAAVAKRTGT